MTDEPVWDPRTQLRLPPHHPDYRKQCGATDKGFFCTVKAGHRNWHAAYGPDPSKGTLHIWYNDPPPDEHVSGHGVAPPEDHHDPER